MTTIDYCNLTEVLDDFSIAAMIHDESRAGHSQRRNLEMAGLPRHTVATLSERVRRRTPEEEEGRGTCH